MRSPQANLFICLPVWPRKFIRGALHKHALLEAQVAGFFYFDGLATGRLE